MARNLFAAILDRIARLAIRPPLVTWRDAGADPRVENVVLYGEGLRQARD